VDPAQARRRLAKADRRLVIVEAARRVFVASGLGARMREIADAAGVNEALIYQHFASKDDLIAAAVVLPLEQVIASLPGTDEGLPPDLDHVAVELFVRRFLEAFAGSVALFGVILFSDRGSAFYRDHLAPVIDRVMVGAHAGLGSSAGHDPRITTLAGVGMCWWLALDAEFRGTTIDIDAATDQLTALLFDGAAAPLRAV
jgi:AcrR family transcriptional regulator